MLALADRWCDLPKSARPGSWAVMLLLSAIICVICYHSPERQPSGHSLRAQWSKVMPLRIEQNQIPLSTTVPFSALAFQRSLVSWQPAASGGELVLEGEWPTLMGAFSRLAASDRAIKAFSLQPDKGSLRMTLQLESLGNE
ncbi:MAG: hypothetical protein ACRCWW_17735 [Scandinavium sp.]|uniref:HofO family protein n=1 Tax=Scandinavium sp. TaxID=2830653 RepID=UPI003F39E52C